MSVGRIVRWQDEKGFGFIKSDDFNKEIFVHISAFPKGSLKPKIGDEVIFLINNTPKGVQATDVRYKNSSSSPIKLELERDRTSPNQNYPIPQRYNPRKKESKAKGIITSAFSLLMLGSIGYYGYTELSQRFANSHREQVAIPSQNLGKIEQSKPLNQNFTCDGRQHCSQMTSKDEAQFFLANCPNVKMDGNGDGDACEQQFGSKF